MTGTELRAPGTFLAGGVEVLRASLSDALRMTVCLWLVLRFKEQMDRLKACPTLLFCGGGFGGGVGVFFGDALDATGGVH